MARAARTARRFIFVAPPPGTILRQQYPPIDPRLSRDDSGVDRDSDVNGSPILNRLEAH
jgi:hypothetical protein